jgi:hypothetical protein
MKFPAARRAFLAVASLLIAGAFAGACSNTANGADACRAIETARCNQLAACDPSFLGSALSCQRFYDTQCERGLPDGVVAPTQTQLDACVAAIGASCDVAHNPQSSAACSFLGAVTDAGDTGATADSQSDATSEAASDAANDASTADSFESSVTDAPTDAPADLSVDLGPDLGPDIGDIGTDDADAGASSDVGDAADAASDG